MALLRRFSDRWLSRRPASTSTTHIWPTHDRRLRTADPTDGCRAGRGAPAGIEEHHEPCDDLRGAGRRTSLLSGVLDSEDTRVMQQALMALGMAIRWDLAAAADGGGGVRRSLAACGGRTAGRQQWHDDAIPRRHVGHRIRRYRLDGVPRMRARPIGDLLGALQQLGAGIESEAGNDCPPVRIRAVDCVAERHGGR